MKKHIFVLGEALMDCIAQPDGQLRPLRGGSPYNMARAASLRGATVHYLNPLSTDSFGQELGAQLEADGVQISPQRSPRPTSLAVVQIQDGQPSYGFYREGIADRDYSADAMLQRLAAHAQAHGPGVLNTGSLLLIPPEIDKVQAVVQQARAAGWTISMDVNLRPQVAGDVKAYANTIRALLPFADWVKASDEDLQTLGFGEARLEAAPTLALALQAACAGAASRIALTFGGDGAYLLVDGNSAALPAPRVAVVDTVGAGDTFWGNCVADWVLGHSASTEATLRSAMQAAAINCTRAGCQPPRWSEVQAFAKGA
jgi:fructokinase